MRFKLLGSIPFFFAQSALAWAQWNAPPAPGAVPPPIPMEGFGGFLQTQQAQRAAPLPVQGFGSFLQMQGQQPMPASVPGRASTMPAATVMPAAPALPAQAAPPQAPSLERTTATQAPPPPVVSESKKVTPVPAECGDECCDPGCVKECYFTKKKKHSCKSCPPAAECETTKPCESPCASPCPKDCCEPKKKPDLCKPCGHFWASADYLLWWINNSPSAVPLLVSGPAASDGIAGSPGTTAVPQNGLGFGPFSGAHVAAGISPVGQPDFAAEFGFLWLFQQGSRTSLASDAGGNPLIALPFTDAQTGAPSRLLLSFPGMFSGNATVAATSQLWGGEANLAGHVLGRTWLNVDGIAGFRYLDLQETLNVNAFSIDLAGTGTFNGAPLPLGTPVFLNDSFRTNNNFYGGQVGFRVEARRGPVYALLTTKVAFGVNHMAVNIAGSSQAGGLTANGGLFALPTNIGAYSDDTFAVIPEVNLTLGYQIGRNWRTYVGYSMLYWDRVARPGDQISGVVNPTQVPLSGVGTGLVGPALPAFSLQHSDFWAHGVNFGLAYHF